MKIVLIALVMMVCGSALASEIDYQKIDPDVLSEMIYVSDLVHCKATACTYVMDQTPFEGRLDHKIDGYHIVFPDNTFSDEDTVDYIDALREFYIDYLTNRPEGL